MISIKRLTQSLRDAGSGLKFVFQNEQNFRIQLAAAVIITIAAIYFSLRTWEAVLVILLMTLVLTMELLNTALEYFSDLFKPRLHHYISAVKDIMAAAVLLVSLGAGIIGLIIFIPHFINLF